MKTDLIKFNDSEVTKEEYINLLLNDYKASARLYFYNKTQMMYSKGEELKKYEFEADKETKKMDAIKDKIIELI